MQLFCQRCQAAYAAATHCPRCGSRLLSPQESYIHSPQAKDPPPDSTPPSFLNRFVVGTLTALGVALGLRECAAALTMVSGGQFSDFWHHSNVDTTTFAIRILAVLFGGLLAGAGRGEGLSVGAAVGLAVGSLFTGFDVYALGSVNNSFALLLAGVYPLVACIAGAAGAWLWPTDVYLPEPTRISNHGSSMAMLAVEDALRRQGHPTAWLKIAAGAILAVIGIIASDPIRFGIAKFSGGFLNTGGMNKSALIGLEIATIASLLGGLIAAMGTGSGLKHGFFAGVLAAAGLLLSSWGQTENVYPAVTGFITFFDLEQAPLSSPKVATHVGLAMIGIMSAAGWLGGTLLPPLAPKNLRNRSLQRQG